MGRSVVLTTAFVLAALFVAGCGGGEGQLFERSIPAPSLRGNLFGDPTEQPIAVYVPPSYASSGDSYPVVYLLTGFTTGVGVFLDGTYQGFALQESMDQLIADGAIDEMIVVVVDGRNSLGWSFFFNSPVTGNWEDYLVRDVVRYVDKNYKTHPFAEKRGLAGHAVGGNAALEVAMRHPDVFCAVYSVNPRLFDGMGLLYTGFFPDKAGIKKVILEHKDWAAMDKDAAHEKFMTFIDGLFASGDEHDAERAFVYAYGAVFSPDPQANAPYALFPHRLSGGQVIVNPTAWTDWDRGFGGIARKAHMYKDSPTKLDAITVDMGGQVPQQMINGADYMSARFDAEGIPHKLVYFDGGLEDKLRVRIEQHMLPFFSRIFSAE